MTGADGVPGGAVGDGRDGPRFRRPRTGGSMEVP